MSESSSSAASGSSTGASQPDIVFLYLPRIISESKSRVGEYSWTAAHMIRADLNNIEVEQSTRSARLTLSSLVAKELESIVKKYQDSSPNTEDTPDFRRLVDEALPRLVAEAREKHPYVSFGASLIPFGLVEAQQSTETLGGIAEEEEEEPEAGPASVGGEQSEGGEGSEEKEGSQDTESSDEKDDSIAGSDTG